VPFSNVVVVLVHYTAGVIILKYAKEEVGLRLSLTDIACMQQQQGKDQLLLACSCGARVTARAGIKILACKMMKSVGSECGDHMYMY
jgi:hypothetical protein